MLSPKKTKFKKLQKGCTNHKKKKQLNLDFGTLGLVNKHSSNYECSQRHLKSFNSTLIRSMRKAKAHHGRFWLRQFPDINRTKKPAEVRMGKGKGSTNHWTARIHHGAVFCEMRGLPNHLMISGVRQSKKKLPFKTVFILNKLF
jgi:large subunit ribosomal protein L16